MSRVTSSQRRGSLKDEVYMNFFSSPAFSSISRKARFPAIYWLISYAEILKKVFRPTSWLAFICIGESTY